MWAKTGCMQFVFVGEMYVIASYFSLFSISLSLLTSDVFHWDVHIAQAATPVVVRAVWGVHYPRPASLWSTIIQLSRVAVVVRIHARQMWVMCSVRLLNQPLAICPLPMRFFWAVGRVPQILVWVPLAEEVLHVLCLVQNQCLLLRVTLHPDLDVLILVEKLRKI